MLDRCGSSWRIIVDTSGGSWYNSFVDPAGSKCWISAVDICGSLWLNLVDPSIVGPGVSPW